MACNTKLKGSSLVKARAHLDHRLLSKFSLLYNNTTLVKVAFSTKEGRLGKNFNILFYTLLILLIRIYTSSPF